MKKLLSTKYTAGAVNTAMFILRLALGILLMSHGYSKLVHFNSMSGHFMNFLGIGRSISLSLVIFAELFCTVFIILGLFTRLAAIPIIILLAVAIFKAHNGQIFGDGEKAMLYLAGYLAIILIGPGRVSVDSMIGK